jgi:hypothetical protein
VLFDGRHRAHDRGDLLVVEHLAVGQQGKSKCSGR